MMYKQIKKTKSVIPVLTALFLIVSCSGCINADSSEAGEENQTSASVYSKFTGELEPNVTISVLENDTAIEKGYFQELLDAFNEAYAEYGIVAVDANMDQRLDLANDGPYGYGPDVIYQANDEIMKYVDERHILPLPVDQLETGDTIMEYAWNAYQTSVDGVEYTFGVPVNVQAPVLYYRKDLLPDNWETEWDDDKNGVPDMIENWSDMYNYSLLVHQNDSEKYGYMKSLFDPYFSLGYLLSYGGYIFGDNNTNPEDIGLSAGEAEKGVNIIRQQASMMNEWCIDDTITTNAYAKIADGTYFATMTTPDVYTTFIELLANNYEDTLGVSEEVALEMAQENLVLADVPMLPASGDLTQDSDELISTKTVGGINGYAISAYTESPNACLAFIEFATSYDMIKLRSEMLGIAPVRSDLAQDSGALTKILYESLSEGNIVIMPPIDELAQIWTPTHTLFADIAKDPYRNENEQKYTDSASNKAALEAVDQQIYDNIFTLSGDPISTDASDTGD